MFRDLAMNCYIKFTHICQFKFDRKNEQQLRSGHVMLKSFRAASKFSRHVLCALWCKVLKPLMTLMWSEKRFEWRQGLHSKNKYQVAFDEVVNFFYFRQIQNSKYIYNVNIRLRLLFRRSRNKMPEDQQICAQKNYSFLTSQCSIVKKCDTYIFTFSIFLLSVFSHLLATL